jgi:hypothetical protein
METAVRERFERIEAILNGVAKTQAAVAAQAETRVQQVETRVQQVEARMAKSDARFEKRMRGFENLVRIGMREITNLRRLNKEGDQKLNALIDAQQRTEASLRAFLDSLRKGGNGHSRAH